MVEKILMLSDEPEKEMDFNLRTFAGEECGLSAALNISHASKVAYTMACAVKPRGEKGAGAASWFKGELHGVRRKGKVTTSFIDVDFEGELPGKRAIIHNRYATKGSPYKKANIQPLFDQRRRIALGHNGTFTNSKPMIDALEKEGVVFQSTSDSELAIHLMARSKKNTLEGRIVDMLRQIGGAYSLLIMTPQKTYAIKDKYGTRPLAVASYKRGHLVCSENYAFDLIDGAKYLFEVEPGEMVVFSGDHFERKQYTDPDPFACVFEYIYFMNKLTRFNSQRCIDFRQGLGREIVHEHHPQKVDVVIPIPESGCEAAIGVAEELRIPYREYITKIDESWDEAGRSFTEPTFEKRKVAVRRKLHFQKEKFKGKDVLLVDDTIVRGVTMKILVEIVRECGAASVSVALSAAPITNICGAGMDFQSLDQIIAYEKKTVEGVREYINADNLYYLSLDGQRKIVDKYLKTNVCDGCFGGRYPIVPIEALH